MRVLLVLLLALVACKEREPRASQPERKMYMIGQLPEFEFQEVNARGIKRDDMIGKVWIAATVFTRCPTHCPAMCQEMYKLQQEFGDEGDFRMMTITVDPAFDTIDVLAKYAKSYYAKPDVWYFVRHPRREPIRKFVMEGLKIEWNAEEPLIHSERLALIDKDGVMRGGYPRSDPDAMKSLRKHVRELLDTPAKQ